MKENSSIEVSNKKEKRKEKKKYSNFNENLKIGIAVNNSYDGKIE